MNRDIITIEDEEPKARVSMEKQFAQAQAALTGIPAGFQEKPKKRINVAQAVLKIRERSKYHRTANRTKVLKGERQEQPVYFLGKVSEAELAHGIGVDKSHMVKLMKGTRAPSVTLLYRMSVYLTAATGEQVTMEDVMRLLELRPWEMK